MIKRNINKLTAARTRKRRDGKDAMAGEQINRERRRVVDARRKAKPDHVVLKLTRTHAACVFTAAGTAARSSKLTAKLATAAAND